MGNRTTFIHKFQFGRLLIAILLSLSVVLAGCASNDDASLNAGFYSNEDSGSYIDSAEKMAVGPDGNYIIDMNFMLGVWQKGTDDLYNGLGQRFSITQNGVYNFKAADSDVDVPVQAEMGNWAFADGVLTLTTLDQVRKIGDPVAGAAILHEILDDPVKTAYKLENYNLEEDSVQFNGETYYRVNLDFLIDEGTQLYDGSHVSTYTIDGSKKTDAVRVEGSPLALEIGTTMKLKLTDPSAAEELVFDGDYQNSLIVDYRQQTGDIYLAPIRAGHFTVTVSLKDNPEAIGKFEMIITDPFSG